MLIPKGDFLNGDGAVAAAAATSRSSCTARRGVRSAEALAVLKGAGFADAVHVGGGVGAWVNQIDPCQPSY